MNDSIREYQDYKMLTDAFLANNGIQHLAQTAFSIFNNPVFVLDSSFKFLAKAYPDKDQHLPEAFSFYFNSSAQFLEKSEIEMLKTLKVPESVSQNTGIFQYHHVSLECDALAMGLRIKNTVVAYIIMPVLNPEGLEGMDSLLITFRDFLVQELLKNRIYQNNRDEYMSYLLLDMLTNKYPDKNIIEKRLSTVDFVPADHMNIVVIRRRIEEQSGCSMDLIEIQLKPVLHGHISAILDDSIVILFNFREGRQIAGNILDAIKQVCTNNDLIAGISNNFYTMSDLVKHYRLATRTALVCQRYIEDHRVIFYDDVFDLALLEYCDRHNNLMDFVHSSILNLMDYDRKYGTDYLYTFWIYTECGCNTQSTAARLYIHKNTLAYRIGKIKEILNSDLTSGKDLFSFQLSMRILRMLGKLAK